jgi:integrase
VAHEKRDPKRAGPRLERRGNTPSWTADLRPFGGRRYTVLLDPSHPEWPLRGRRTEDEEQARLWSWQYVERLTHGALSGRPAERVELSVATEAFLSHRRATMASGTVATSKTAVTRLLEWFGGSVAVGEITAKALQSKVDGMSRAGYASGTIHTNVQSMGAFFDYATRTYGIKHNPAHGLVLPAMAPPDAEAWGDETLPILRKAADDLDRTLNRRPGFRLALELGLCTGLRQHELFALHWDQVDPDSCTCRVTQQLGKYSTVKLIPLKGRRSRTVLILPEWWQHHRPAKGPILRGVKGIYLPTRGQQQVIDRIYNRAGLAAAGRGWHILRHTYSRMFIERGGRFEELQRSLGHKSILTTEQTYGHFHEDRAAAAARARIYLVRDGAGEG